MSGEDKVVAYWMDTQSRALDMWQVELLKTLNGRLQHVDAADRAELVETIDDRPRPVLLTYKAPLSVVAGRLDSGDSLAKALDAWSTQAAELLEFKRIFSTNAVLIDERMLQQYPDVVLAKLSIAIDGDVYAITDHASRLSHEPTLNEHVASIALAQDPWCRTVKKIEAVSADATPVTMRTETLASLEELRHLATSRIGATRENAKLAEENSLLLDHLHEAEESLRRAVRDRLASTVELKEIKKSIAERGTLTQKAENREEELKTAVAKERERIVRFKEKIRQLRNLLHEEREARKSAEEGQAGKA